MNHYFFYELTSTISKTCLFKFYVSNDKSDKSIETVHNIIGICILKYYKSLMDFSKQYIS